MSYDDHYDQRHDQRADDRYDDGYDEPYDDYDEIDDEYPDPHETTGHVGDAETLLRRPSTWWRTHRPCRCRRRLASIVTS